MINDENLEVPPEFGTDDVDSRRIACLFNTDVKEFIADLERYTGCYIDKRFWESRFWLTLKARYCVETTQIEK